MNRAYRIVGIIKENGVVLGYKALTDIGVVLNIRVSELSKHGVANFSNVLYNNGQYYVSDIDELPVFDKHSKGRPENKAVICATCKDDNTIVGYKVLLPMGVIKTVRVQDIVSLTNMGVQLLNATITTNGIILSDKVSSMYVNDFCIEN